MLRFWSYRPRPYVARVRAIHATLLNNAEEAAKAAKTSTPPKWTPNSIRTGVIARKRGMTAMWDEHGARYPVTVLQLEHCQVTANVETERKDGSKYHAVQVAASDRPKKTTSKAMIGHFKKAGVGPKYIVREFPVTPDAHVPVGTTLSAIHFVPGQYVDVIANSIGKGFQGVMKRWGFHGGPASHGTSLAHRTPGSTGGHQDPGRVWPGKKMPGRMGGKQRTTQNLVVMRVDSTLDLVFVRGCVPGFDDAHVMIRDAKKKMTAAAQVSFAKGNFDKVLPNNIVDLPFPAGTPELAKTLPPVIVCPATRISSPFTPRE